MTSGDLMGLQDCISVISAVDLELSLLAANSKECLSQTKQEIKLHTNLDKKSELVSEYALADAISVAKERQNLAVQKQILQITSSVKHLLDKLQQEKEEIQNKKNTLSSVLQVEVESQVNTMRFDYEKKLMMLEKENGEYQKKMVQTKELYQSLKKRLNKLENKYGEKRIENKEKITLIQKQNAQINALSKRLTNLNHEKDELMKEINNFDNLTPVDEEKMNKEKKKQQQLLFQIEVLDKQFLAKKNQGPKVDSRLQEQMEAEVNDKENVHNQLYNVVRVETQDIEDEARCTFTKLSQFLIPSEPSVNHLVRSLEKDMNGQPFDVSALSEVAQNELQILRATT